MSAESRTISPKDADFACILAGFQYNANQGIGGRESGI